MLWTCSKFWMLFCLTENLFFVCNMIMLYLVCTIYISYYILMIRIYVIEKSGIVEFYFILFPWKDVEIHIKLQKWLFFPIIVLASRFIIILQLFFFENPLGLEGIIPKSFIESSFLSSTNHGFFEAALVLQAGQPHNL